MIIVSFQLSMPGAASWNGKWSGEGRPYFIVRKFSNKFIANNKILGSFSYRWDDGWCACVTAEIVDSKEAARRRKASVGFSGYDWMVDSIILTGTINASSHA